MSLGIMMDGKSAWTVSAFTENLRAYLNAVVNTYDVRRRGDLCRRLVFALPPNRCICGKVKHCMISSVQNLYKIVYALKYTYQNE